MTKCIDLSNYSGNHPTGIPTPDDVQCLLADGWQTAIVGCSYGTIATAQLEACAAGGMDVEAYAFIEFRDGWEAAIDRALAALTSPVRRLWLDCEETSQLGPSGTVQRIHDAIAYVHAARPDLQLGIYTGGWWWTPTTNDCHEFADMPLWTAEYDSRIVSPTMYGGWTQAAIWQYQGSVDTCGLNTDRNIIMEQEEDMAAIELVWCPDTQALYVLGQGDPRWIADQAAAAELRKVYGPEKIGLSIATLKQMGAK